MADEIRSEYPAQTNETPAERAGGATRSMHNGVAVSCDCCSCEAEPYWVEGMHDGARRARVAASSE